MKPQEKKLLAVFRQLDEADQQSVRAFAEFLSARGEKVNEPVPEPELIAPKENESVVGALKRLSKSYPMLDKSKMLNDTSLLVSQHVVQGRDKQEVIQELEAVFEKYYQQLLEESGS